MSKKENNPSVEGNISLSDFSKGIKPGLNRFVILQAVCDKVLTKKGMEVDAISLQVELADIENPSSKEILQNHLIFMNFKENSAFHKFVVSVVEATGKESLFNIGDLVGLEGTVELSYYRPEGSESSFPRLNQWNFSVTENDIHQALTQYADNLDLDADLEEIQ